MRSGRSQLLHGPLLRNYQTETFEKNYGSPCISLYISCLKIKKMGVSFIATNQWKYCEVRRTFRKTIMNTSRSKWWTLFLDAWQSPCAWNAAKMDIGKFIEALGTDRTALADNLRGGSTTADTIVNSVINLTTTAYGF